ncbi:flavodoxin [Lachnobacterium bovis]|uniref:Flavodoxin n=1 Tax=Lachnobacterium bovis TaxID=140626 RepID=A0A1H9PTA5_9FIRM|nr:flavodoxin [Lachnobacterium bovis]SER51422.1 flavodoxin, short chain [Lachnobacterium bovis]
MDKVKVIYWSQTGNTAAMAQAVAEGIKKEGKEAEILDCSSVSVADLKEEKAFALGCPAMGAEELEEGEMEPLVEEICAICASKTIALFGSYGWGDGEWMRNWVDRMKEAGAVVLNDEGVICQEYPGDEAILNCENLGKQLAAV